MENYQNLPPTGHKLIDELNALVVEHRLSAAARDHFAKTLVGDSGEHIHDLLPVSAVVDLLVKALMMNEALPADGAGGSLLSAAQQRANSAASSRQTTSLVENAERRAKEAARV